MKKLFLFALVIVSFSLSFATPPVPNEYVLKTSAASDLIVEAIVSKRDTINISADESYFLFTLDVIHVFKNKLAENGNSIQLLVKRNLPLERGEVMYSHGGPWNSNLKEKYIFFLNQNKLPSLTKSKYYIFTSHYTDSKIKFTNFDYSEYKAHGFGIYFKSVPALYLFIKSLPQTIVSASLTDSVQFRKEKYDPTKDSTYIRITEENKRKRAEYQRQRDPSQEKILLEKHNQIQKKKKTK